ncbi:hypothetical protein COCMIDRAFT_83561 [Bipolaris oryzae ATCC 44560]|uniref:Uncharacterized protein n=1 Tax=Bipolaris oryzae ATCC 44560 TaxID=930090 RepID=W6ZDH7_COCMI|nr:uncharacterized protein COCMIDRAFT_83561 [Bipolaris oryzae ATCC 44560]EUC49872.1 hypothetical protein COCMIDRAFT_83561 [Bipolaris oryzae ATCC 44560]
MCVGPAPPASPASLQHLHIPRQDAFATWAIHTSAKAVGKIIAAELGQEYETIDPRADMCLVKTALLSCSGVSVHQADISSLQNQSHLSPFKPPISPSSHPNSDGNRITKVPVIVAWRPLAKNIRGLKSCPSFANPKRCLSGLERFEGPPQIHTIHMLPQLLRHNSLRLNSQARRAGQIHNRYQYFPARSPLLLATYPNQNIAI